MPHHPGSLIGFTGQHCLMKGKTHTFWENPGLRTIGTKAQVEFIITGQLPQKSDSTFIFAGSVLVFGRKQLPL
jgi:hypothetical protein